jgi:transcriptional regulator with GAF, ATPase, and Fis domain
VYTPLIVGLSTLCFTIGLYYCFKRVLNIRFLNCKDVVETAPRTTFVYYFQDIIEKLHLSKNIQELSNLTDEFFETNFSVQTTHISLFIRSHSNEKNQNHISNKLTQDLLSTVENAITNQDHQLCNLLNQDKILIYDDLVFNDFYNTSDTNRFLITFLESLRAAIFLPIIDKEKIIAFIIIHHNARLELYSNIDRHEMILYAKYLATRINAFLHDTNACSHQEKKLKDDLYKKHLEITHYKESIRSFLTKSQSQEIGIIFFNNNRFEYANESAKKLAEQIGNKESHPLLTSFKNSARYVERYHTPYNCYTCDGKGNRYLITTVYNHAGNNCIISVSRADLSESITEKIALLNNPSRFDYLLYLETTKPGHRINNLIPGSCAELINFKLQLLEAAFSKKAALLQVSNPDRENIVTYLHETSSRGVLHVIDAQEAGIDFNALLLGCDKTKQVSLLETLNNIGTLHIENIDQLDISLQKKLADVIKYGFFTRPLSDKKITVNVRILCSTQQKLSSLIKQGSFSAELYQELKDSILTMPELKLLALPELVEIGQKYLLQENLPLLSHDYVTTLFKNTKPNSLHELKTILYEQSQLHNGSLIRSNDYLHVIKPELAQAARLGKQALKNPLLMSQLWQTFKCQSRIADYLGVNRSSVSRRCKEYSLVD